MHNLFLSLTALAIIVFSPAAYADDMTSICGRFASSLNGQINGILGNNQMVFTDKRAKLTAMFEQDVDVPWMAQHVAGSAWTAATEQDRADFVAAYRKYLSQHYMGSLDEGDFREMFAIKTLDFKMFSDGMYAAHTEVARYADEPLSFDLKFAEEPVGNCHIRDFTVEGISQVTTQRAEMQQLLATHDLKYVTQRLHKMAQSMP